MKYIHSTQIFTALLSGIAIILAFRLSSVFDSWLAYASNISLFFLPAGIKLLLLLVLRTPAFMGMWIAGVYLGAGLYFDSTFFSVVLLAFVNLITYALAILAAMHFLGVHSDLRNLKYWHIVVISVAASLLSGIVNNLVFMLENMTSSQELWAKSAAMAFGDFVGCFVVVSLFQAVIQLLGSSPSKPA
ncbi:hypothetical protein [Limnohabitans sp. B9-3]|uniref:hypothetical protein n=1 Tax=Limnohabitans sp. B9-3 TaxID=1100707 RepID=UPI000C1F0AB5|nr:hypothetical protein [Limnohabitans sp. B9-3]PIT76280.1 hypothetical protein B9Z42_06165 [Limnohabitans sp. B9-3]